MIQSFRPGAPLAVLLLAVALPAMADATPPGDPRAPQATPSTAPAPVAHGCDHASQAGTWSSFVLPWTVLPSRFEDWSWTAMRVQWDPESESWGVATSSDPAGAGVFGARLPSDRPIQVTRPDGTVMLLIGPEGMEYVTVQRGPDGRFHHQCAQEPSTSMPATGWPEK